MFHKKEPRAMNNRFNIKGVDRDSHTIHKLASQSSYKSYIGRLRGQPIIYRTDSKNIGIKSYNSYIFGITPINYRL